MIQNRWIEVMVGVFILAGLSALLVLTLKVSGLAHHKRSASYMVTAEFDNIGSLKLRAPVRIAGVNVGRVADIRLDKATYRAKVTLYINRKNKLPTDTSARILTEGLLGANYISLSPGYKETLLRDDGQIVETHPALVLENLIGQLLFELKPKEKK